MNPDLYDGYRTAAGHARQLADWWLLQLDTWGLAVFLTVHAAVLLAAWCLIGATCHLAERIRDRRELRRTPAAPDNVPPVDDELLIRCRAIDREPLADPDVSRHAINYLRDNAGEEDSL